MIEQQARVLRTDGPTAWVAVGGQSGCTACDAGKGCGAGIFGRLLKRRTVELALPNGIEARAGQAVNLGMPETLFLKLVFRLYATPLIAGLVGAVICHQIGMTYLAGPGAVDLAAGFGMVAGAALGIGVVRRRGTQLPADGVHLMPAMPGSGCEKSAASQFE